VKITIEPTNVFAPVGEVETRIWDGITDEGIRCKLCVALIAVRAEADHSDFQRVLTEIPAGFVFVPLAKAMTF
jgi:hypothetical protein